MPYQLPLDRKDLTFSNGLNTSQDPASIDQGELTEATGCEYHIGSPHLYKQPGRSLCATLPGGNQLVRAVQHLQYDQVASVLAAYGGDGALYESPVSLTPNFSSSGLVVTGSATPQFNSYNNQWIMCNGVDINYVREPTPPATPTGYFGHWRQLGMKAAFGTTTISPLTTAPTAPVNERAWSGTTTTGATSGFTSPTLAYDSTSDPDYQTTYAEGVAANNANVLVSTTWDYTQSVTASLTNYSVKILFQHIGTDATVMHIEYSFDNGVTYTLAYQHVGSGQGEDTGITTLDIPITSACTDLTNVKIKVGVRAFNLFRTSRGRIYDIRMVNVGSTSSSTVTTENNVSYAVTERFYDGDGVAHESVATTFSAPQLLTNAYAVKVYLPGIDNTGSGTTVRNNPMTTEFVIYRSVDEPGGGYPIMWQIDTVAWSSTNGGGGSRTYYQDDLSKDITLSPPYPNAHLYDVIRVLYPDGSQLPFEINRPPPLSTMSLTYQGSIVYWPAVNTSRLYYSIPTTLSNRAAEQVPDVYFLDFQTPQADLAITGALTNGGRSLIVYFPAYTMLVNYLPQANDPGVFDSRVREYVSQSRGASGRFCATSFSLPSGVQLAAAVDTLGLWATDGVSGILDWVKDLNWTNTDKTGLVDGADLSTGQLRDNSEMRRLEFLYTDSNGDRKELHFFYGEMKENGLPKVTGPHPAGTGDTSALGWGCAHYVFADTTPRMWLGWKGSGYPNGRIYLERIATNGDPTYADASLAYNAIGDIPFTATSGDNYLYGLGQAGVLTMGVPKFTGEAQKSFDVEGTFRRDGAATAITETKAFLANTNSKMYWQRYADRHRVSVQDISHTQSPALVAYEMHFRGGGMSKDGQ